MNNGILALGYNPQEDERGFTLLELLVAMTILSLVALIMMGGLKLGAKVWERAQIASDNTDSIEAAQTIIRRQLSAIYPQWEDIAPGQAHILFEGTSQSVAFLAPPPMQFGFGADLQFELQLSANHNLDLIWQSEKSSAPPARSTLLQDVSSIRFEYYGSPVGSTVAAWTNIWSDRTRLPLLIKLGVSFPPGDKRVWPELVVRPEIFVDVKCVYDPISRTCRGRPE